MPQTLPFDTHESVKRLVSVGFTVEQAEVQTGIIKELLETQQVTREYLDKRLSEAESRLIKWFVGFLLVQTGLIAALVKLL